MHLDLLLKEEEEKEEDLDVCTLRRAAEGDKEDGGEKIPLSHT